MESAGSGQYHRGGGKQTTKKNRKPPHVPERQRQEPAIPANQRHIVLRAQRTEIMIPVRMERGTGSTGRPGGKHDGGGSIFGKRRHGARIFVWAPFESGLSPATAVPNGRSLTASDTPRLRYRSAVVASGRRIEIGQATAPARIAARSKTTASTLRSMTSATRAPLPTPFSAMRRAVPDTRLSSSPYDTSTRGDDSAVSRGARSAAVESRQGISMRQDNRLEDPSETEKQAVYEQEPRCGTQERIQTPRGHSWRAMSACWPAPRAVANKAMSIHQLLASIADATTTMAAPATHTP